MSVPRYTDISHFRAPYKNSYAGLSGMIPYAGLGGSVESFSSQASESSEPGTVSVAAQSPGSRSNFPFAVTRPIDWKSKAPPGPGEGPSGKPAAPKCPKYYYLSEYYGVCLPIKVDNGQRLDWVLRAHKHAKSLYEMAGLASAVATKGMADKSLAKIQVDGAVRTAMLVDPSSPWRKQNRDTLRQILLLAALDHYPGIDYNQPSDADSYVSNLAVMVTAPARAHYMGTPIADILADMKYDLLMAKIGIGGLHVPPKPPGKFKIANGKLMMIKDARLPRYRGIDEHTPNISLAYMQNTVPVHGPGPGPEPPEPPGPEQAENRESALDLPQTGQNAAAEYAAVQLAAQARAAAEYEAKIAALQVVVSGPPPKVAAVDVDGAWPVKDMLVSVATASAFTTALPYVGGAVVAGLVIWLATKDSNKGTK